MPKRDSGQTKAKPSSKKKSADAIQMLKEDHRKVEELFNQFREEESGKKQQIAQQIFHELEVHSTLEEELFYPALQNQGEVEESSKVSEEEIDAEEPMNASELDREGQEEVELEEENSSEDADEMIAGAYDDHRAVRDMIAQLRNSDASSREFRQSMMELQQMVADHVSQEEDELFPQAQLSLDIKTLGMQMEQRKQEILSAAA